MVIVESAAGEAMRAWVQDCRDYMHAPMPLSLPVCLLSSRRPVSCIRAVLRLSR